MVDVFEPPSFAGTHIHGVAKQNSRDGGFFSASTRHNLLLIDRAFAVLLMIQWAVAVVLACTIAPLTWEGTKSSLHPHLIATALLGGLVVLPPVLLALMRPGETLTRHCVAIAQMLMSALFIHLSRGRIETHFHIFGSLAFLACYRDWKVLITATIVVALDHGLRAVFFPLSVYGPDVEHPIGRTIEHVGWVLFEVLFLSLAGRQANRVQEEVLRKKAQEMGQYRLVKRLGAGGMGEVYLAEHHLLQRPCALKLIRPEKATDEKMLERFEREVQSTAKLQHPCSVRIYDYGNSGQGRFFYVMEYLNGKSFAQLVIDEGPLDPIRLIRLLRQAAGALAEAHDVGLVHRDVNPNNLFVCDMGGLCDLVKLLDFGLVQAMSGETEETPDDQRLTQEGFFLGTPAYVSPEQAYGRRVDGRSDLYSLGCVAYFGLTGHPVFLRATTLETLIAHAREGVPPLETERPGTPEELIAIINRCLEKDPDDRFATAHDLDHALTECSMKLTNRSSEPFVSCPPSNSDQPGTAPVAQEQTPLNDSPETILGKNLSKEIDQRP